jgi:hypothetical protein
MTENSYFDSRTFEEVLLEGQKLKERKKIGGAFLYEDTITYLFSRTNYGKSLFVFQLAYAAATGTSVAACPALQNDCPPMKTLVVDLELDKQVLWKRHGKVLENKNPYLSNLSYVHEKLENKMLIGPYLLEKIEEEAIRRESALVIIDNISKLLPDSLKPDIVTCIISMINNIRKKTGAAILVIGHTTKGNPQFAIQPTDYFGSSMIQNFFSEVSFLDKTNDNKFFLCHSKTKHKELYNTKVPVFKRGEHPVVGVGFTFQKMQNIEKIQLPLFGEQLPDNKVHLRNRRDLKEYTSEIRILFDKGTSVQQIAAIMGVTRPAIYNALHRSEA